MADDSDLGALKDKFDALTKQMTQMNKLFGKFNSNSSGSGGSAIKQTGKDMESLSKKSKSVESGFGLMIASSNTLVKSLSQGAVDIKGFVHEYGAVYKAASSKFGIGAGLVVSSLAIAADAIGGEVKDIVKQYQDMRDIGQTYGGSIIGLGEAAARSRMSLDDYSKFMSKNSQVASVVPIAEWSANLRSSMRDVGQLGMSTSEVNDVLGSYTKIMSMSGKLQSLSMDDAVSSTKDLAIEMTALAGVSGKSRKAILEDTQAAMNTATLRAAISEKEGQAGIDYANSITKATMFLASIPGEGGQFFSKMLAETAGAGAAFLTQSGQTMVNAGMFGVNNMMDAMNNKIKAGGKLSSQEQANFYQEFLKEGKANMENLRMQAMAGNQDAAKAIDIITDMENNAGKYTAANIEKQQEMAKKQEAGTKALSNLEDTFNAVSSSIREGFWKTIEAFVASPAYKDFTDKLTEMGNQLSAWFSKFFTPQNIDSMLDTVTSIGKAFWTAGSIVISVLQGLGTVINWVVQAFNKIHDTLGNVGTALAALAVYKFAKNFKKAGQVAKDRAAMAEQATMVGEGVTKALARFAMGNALRVYETNAKASGGGGNLPDDKYRKETVDERNRRIRNKGKLGGAVQEAEEVAEEAGHNPLAKEAEGVFAKEAGKVAKSGLLSRGLGLLKTGAASMKSPNPLVDIGLFAGSVGLDLAANSDSQKDSTWAKYARHAMDEGGTGATIGGLGGMAFGGVGAGPGAMIGGALGALKGIYDEWKDEHAKLKADAVAPKDPDNKTVGKNDPTSQQSVAANLQKQQDDAKKNVLAQQALMSKILDALQKGNAQDRALANQAQDNMKKLGMNISPNKV
jgi:hypothetical protein